MDTIRDFEDFLVLLERSGVRYLIVGGLAFTFHAMPRYTKDIDIWIAPDPKNVERVNQALETFGSPELLDPESEDEILQIGVAPSRIDLLRVVGPVPFETAWGRRIDTTYGEANVHWIDLDSLIEIKRAIDHPRHQEDARILEMVRERRESKKK